MDSAHQWSGSSHQNLRGNENRTYRGKNHPLRSPSLNRQAPGIDIGRSAHHGEKISPSQFRARVLLRAREMESPNGSAFCDHRDDLFVSRPRRIFRDDHEQGCLWGKDTSSHGQSFKADVRKYPPAAKHRGIRARLQLSARGRGHSGGIKPAIPRRSAAAG